MKNVIGLFLLFLSSELFADQSGVLYLRARVPASYSISLEMQGKTLVPVINSNRARVLPKVSVSLKKNIRLVSVVHP